MPSKKPTNHQLNRPVILAPRLSSYKRETTPKQPSSNQDWVTNRNSSSSTSLGPTENVFVWKPADMLGVPKELIEHELKVNLKPRQRSSGYNDSPRISKEPSRKSWRNYSQLRSSWKSTIQSGWPTLYLSRKRITTSAGSVSMTLTSRSTAQRILLGYRALIK